MRAAVDNQRMAGGLGINVERAFASTFALGSGLAGLGGALAIEIVGLDPNFAFTYLVYVLIILVSVGGLGSIAAHLPLRILIGVSDVAGKCCAGARHPSDLSGHGGGPDVAACWPGREALAAMRISFEDQPDTPVTLHLRRHARA